MTNDDLKQLLLSVRVIASVGLSSNAEKDSYAVASYLQEQGYRLIPVNPTAKEILGEPCYPDLQSIPDPVDVVQLFRPSADVPPLVDQAIAIGAKVVWMQAGIQHDAAAAKAQAAGLTVVQDKCMRVLHRMLIGSASPQ